MRILYAYHSDDPTEQTGSKLGALSYHGPTQRGARRLYLIERVNLEEPLQRDLHFWDLRNPVVSTTQLTDLSPVHIFNCICDLQSYGFIGTVSEAS
jgi:hypothetical protein